MIQERRRGKSLARMAGRERIIIASVRALRIDRCLEAVRNAGRDQKRGGMLQEPLFVPFDKSHKTRENRQGDAGGVTGILDRVAGSRCGRAA